jgi:hypothetical protein
MFNAMGAPPNPTWVILSAANCELFFEGTFEQFSDCYGGGAPLNASPEVHEADIVGWVLRMNRREKDALNVYRRVDTNYSIP